MRVLLCWINHSCVPVKSCCSWCLSRVCVCVCECFFFPFFVCVECSEFLSFSFGFDRKRYFFGGRRNTSSFCFQMRNSATSIVMCLFRNFVRFPSGFRRRRQEIRPSPWRPIEAQHPTVSSFSSWQFWHSIPVISPCSIVSFLFYPLKLQRLRYYVNGTG